MRKRKILLALLTLCLLLACIPASVFAQSGSFTWTLEEGILTISGAQMPDWDGNPPWYASRTQIQAVVIQEGMTNIGAFAFMSCTNLTNVAIPDSVTDIHDGAFYGCTSLTEFTIPEGVRVLGKGVFAQCTGLVSISIPKSLDFVEHITVFSRCSNLTTIRVAEGNPSYTSPDGLLCSADKTTLLCVPAGRKGILILPESITVLQYGAFLSCGGITGITFPKELSDMGSEDFSGCTNLESVVFQGDRPDFGYTIFPAQTIVYYPAGNATWAIGGQNNGRIGGKQPWQTYDLYDSPELESMLPPPEPTQPEPTVPEPTAPEPTNPAPTQPQPTQPTPTQPIPTQPKPTDPQPTDPVITDPTPTDTKPNTTGPQSGSTGDTVPAADGPAPQLSGVGLGRIAGWIALSAVLFGAGIFCGILLYKRKKEK